MFQRDKSKIINLVPLISDGSILIIYNRKNEMLSFCHTISYLKYVHLHSSKYEKIPQNKAF